MLWWVEEEGKGEKGFLGGGGMHAETNLFGSESATMKCELLASAIKRERWAEIERKRSQWGVFLKMWDWGRGRDSKERKMITDCDNWLDKRLWCVLWKNESWERGVRKGGVETRKSRRECRLTMFCNIPLRFETVSRRKSWAPGRAQRTTSQTAAMNERIALTQTIWQQQKDSTDQQALDLPKQLKDLHYEPLATD